MLSSFLAKFSNKFVTYALSITVPSFTQILTVLVPTFWAINVAVMVPSVSEPLLLLFVRVTAKSLVDAPTVYDLETVEDLLIRYFPLQELVNS